MCKLRVPNWNRRLESPVLRFGVSKTGLVPTIKDGVGGVASPESKSAIGYRPRTVGQGLDDNS